MQGWRFEQSNAHILLNDNQAVYIYVISMIFQWFSWHLFVIKWLNFITRNYWSCNEWRQSNTVIHQSLTCVVARSSYYILQASFWLGQSVSIATFYTIITEVHKLKSFTITHPMIIVYFDNIWDHWWVAVVHTSQPWSLCNKSVGYCCLIFKGSHL